MGFFASDFDPRGTNRKLRSLRVPPYCRGTRICPAKLLPTAISAANFSKFHHGLHHFLANVQDGLYYSDVIFFPGASSVRRPPDSGSRIHHDACRLSDSCFLFQGALFDYYEFWPTIWTFGRGHVEFRSLLCLTTERRLDLDTSGRINGCPASSFPPASAHPRGDIGFYRVGRC